MSGISAELDKALAAIKTLGQGAESKEVPLGQFLKLLTEYQKNKAAFQAQETREKRVIGGVKLGTAGGDRGREAKKISDPDLTIVDAIKVLDAKALRAQLQSKVVPVEERGWGEEESPAEKANSAWNDLLALLNQVSPEAVVVATTVVLVESKRASASKSSSLEDDAKLAERLQAEEHQRMAQGEDEKEAPAPGPQVSEQLIGDPGASFLW